MLSSKFILLSFIGAAFGAANDWSKPCLDGVCFYDLPSSAGSASGTLKIWGSPDSIADITTAGGWEILDCQKDTLSQDIRLVCSDETACDNLYKSIGAVGKIARLPERCGENAFAHISRAWVPEDQSIPEHIARRLVRRDGVQPEVKALHVDTDFSSADAARTGNVNFAIQAANVPGADQTFPPNTGRLEKRLFGFVKKAINAVTDLNNVSIDEVKTLDPFEINDTFNLLDGTLSCPPLEGRLKLDVTAKANALAAIGVAAEGTIIPPKIDDFAVTATVTADLDGTINLKGGLSGSIDSGKISLFEVGIPGLNFPGILTVGPSFRIDALASANLDVNADLAVGINYKIEKASLVFPPSSEKAAAQGGSFNLGDTPLKLSVSPAIQATGTVTAHLIPSLNLGISALAGAADATVFLELDASASMKLELQGQANAAVTVNPRDTIAARATGDLDVNSNAEAALVDLRSFKRVVGRSIARRKVAPAHAPATKTASASFGGCFEILAGLDVNVGANAEFFGLFDAGTSVSLFSKEFELFKKCFGSQPARRSLRFMRTHSHPARSLVMESTLAKRALACLPVNEPGLEALVDQVIAGPSVKPLA